MKAKLFVRTIALIALVTTLLIGSTMLASAPLISVELCIDLQGTRSAGMDEPVVYDLVDGSGANVVTGATANAVIPAGDDDTGCFATDAVAPAVYDVVFHSSDAATDHLTNVVEGVNFQTDSETIVLMEGGANAVLIEGDANSDNSVSGADSSILVSSLNIFFALCDGDAGYDARADFNEDGCVTGADSSILVSNLNIFIAQTGDTP